MPKVSIILTSFNHAKYLREAIDSVLNQSFGDWELLIWDDASTDESWDIISDYRDPRIQAFRNVEQMRALWAINKAITEVAKADFLAIHHSDDLWESDKLAKQVAYLDQYPDIGAVFTCVQPVNETGEPLTDEKHFYYNIFDQPNRSRHEWLRFFLAKGNALCHPSVLIRKNCYDRCGLYRPGLAQVPDFDMWIRLCMQFDIHIIQEKLVRFRVRNNDANISGDRPEVRIRGAYEYYLLLANYRRISSFSALCQIFPEARSYDRGLNSIIEFALAKILLELKPHPFVSLFALDLLFSLISDPVMREKLSKNYQFDYKHFVSLTGLYDPWNIKHIEQLNGTILDIQNQKDQLDGDVKQRDCEIVKFTQILQHRDDDIDDLNQALEKQNDSIALKNQSIIELNQQNVSLLTERDASISKIDEMLQSSSWKLTSPIRFLGHLLKGNFVIAWNVVQETGHKMLHRQPATSLLNFGDIQYGRLKNWLDNLSTSSENHNAIAAIVRQRCDFTRSALTVDPLSEPDHKVLTSIDICVVTYNSSRWISGFVTSLLELDYPKELLSVFFVDNSSTDSTLNDLQAVALQLRAAGLVVEITKRPNLGFGSGHNAAIARGKAPFCLVTNIDLEFEIDALCRVVAVAQRDDKKIAAWELRQKPYEHPKFYDPVTGLTNWNSHACVLLRRSAFEQVEGYDTSLFMYGEDVELSYRLRRAGYLLRYCPQAVVWHYTYESDHKVKPLQYLGSTFANLYLRLKYGTGRDILAVPMLGWNLLHGPEVYPGSRKAVLKNLLKLLKETPKAFGRKRNDAFFSFRNWDYELGREGAFVKHQKGSLAPPLVSIITRTYSGAGREMYLRQALLSVAHQTYSNIEHIVVEDGGQAMRPVVDNISQTTGRAINFVESEKLGRSVAGNIGLSVAKGHWCLFLDDDDLLFADHVELLVDTLIAENDAVAAYSLAWELITDSAELSEGQYIEKSHAVLAILRHEYEYEALKIYNYIAIQSILFERKLYEERGGFDENMDALEDWVLWKKYAHGNQFSYVPKVTSMFRTPSNESEIKKRQKILDDAYPEAVEKSIDMDLL